MPAAPPQHPLLAVEAVTKRYGAFAAVSGIELVIRPGELFALLGASGSGKTTLLRLIAGLDQPDAGRIRINGVDVTDRPPYERPVNTVFQSYALFPHMSVRSNVAFGLKQEGLRRSEIDARVAQMLDLVQMAGFADRRPAQLSGGQKQRVALARSLAKLPELLLLDEPMAALDRRLREQTRQELAAIQRRIGITFILVTHDQDEAMSLADRMAVMDHGSIVQIGTPREIYERPSTRFVAGFVGDSNLLQGQVIRCDGESLAVRTRDGDVRVHHSQPIAEGTPVWIAIRPERLRLDEGGAGDNRVEVQVQHAEYRGDVSVVNARCRSGQDLKIAIPNRKGAGPGIAGTAFVSWSPDDGSVLTQ
jgi:putrescine transport system ATP-binding protein